ncbi:hypothetical protein KL933_002724 [Ogataea haglerorum]|uniref:Calponin-homology (CH) domain-containing protein n=1 Tax=Ogataea haglerorum TaxID=1937702 RepID=A0AAN6D4W3_9ASCO|nr:uncharacterized protein KL911_000860 [Ogataea haglerorum]KAG7697674.1 hypothetical protein KL951_002248 [Ogataea haglerorum]KAG7701275.1 hypothetical protein KL915_000306 [Ogataea haglerorum]KAG7706494.1 hypothetical protein KL950_003159 [Ogataea haglerorum]KAG7709233.1 hypothetical protein KL914_001623 [Ogataea haglerorum]KAG7717903.1 hypothetical protein KL913_002839 [Ogataea haglerorum]
MKDVSNLDEDLKTSRSKKYNNPSLQNEVKDWLLHVMGSSINENELRSTDLVDFLKSGEVLSQLINCVWGPNTLPVKKSKMAFVQMESIEQFLNFIKSEGVPQDELFQTVDLYERRDPYQVVMAIQSLSRLMHKRFGDRYPLIGPAIAAKHERPKVPPKPKKFSANSGAAWSTIEYGYMSGSNQKTENIVFGARRDIVKR